MSSENARSSRPVKSTLSAPGLPRAPAARPVLPRHRLSPNEFRGDSASGRPTSSMISHMISSSRAKAGRALPRSQKRLQHLMLLRVPHHPRPKPKLRTQWCCGPAAKQTPSVSCHRVQGGCPELSHAIPPGTLGVPSQHPKPEGSVRPQRQSAGGQRRGEAPPVPRTQPIP